MSISVTPLMLLAVKVGAPVTVDPGPHGRRFIPIVGGEVSGGLSGKILNGGGDWQTLLPDGSLEIQAHYIVDIAGQGPVEIHSSGIRHASASVLDALARGELVDPDQYYFRTSIRMRTAAPGLARLNYILALSSGRREADTVHLDVFEVG